MSALCHVSNRTWPSHRWGMGGVCTRCGTAMPALNWHSQEVQDALARAAAEDEKRASRRTNNPEGKNS